MSQGEQAFPVPLQLGPFSGNNADDAAPQLAPEELVDSLNFFFNNRSAHQRGKWTSVAITGLVDNPSTLVAFKSFLVANLVNHLLITDQTSVASKLYKVNMTTGAATQLTGPAFVPISGYQQTINVVAVNGNALVSGCDSILRHVPGAAAYTAVAGVHPIFLTSHLSRAIGAFDSGAANGQMIVMGSVPGDETDWTTYINGAFTSTLSDIPDGITGLGVLHNTLFVPHRKGFHLGFATGIANPPYRFENWSKDEGVGVFNAPSLAIYNNVAYFTAEDDVYTFDLNNGVQSIGRGVKGSLLYDIINASRVYKGCIWRVSGPGPVGALKNIPRVRYALVPVLGGLGSSYIHMYDIEDKTWSKHDFPAALYSASQVNFSDDNTTQGTGVYPLCLVGSGSAQNPLLYYIDETNNCEAASYLVSKVVRPGPLAKDFTLRRAIVSFRDFGASNAIKLTASCTLGTAAKTANQTRGGLNNDGKWVRDWYDLQVSGQNFQFRVDVAAGLKCEVDALEVYLSESGTFRGNS